MVELNNIQEQILEKVNALVVTLNNQGKATYISKSAANLLGYPAEALTGDNWWSVTRFSKPEGEEIKSKIMRLFKEGPILNNTFEHVFKTAHGLKKWIRWNVSFLDDEQLIAIGYDVTEKKLTEERLLQANKELTDINKAMTDGIAYARRIQQSVLQSTEYISTIFKRHFVLYKPKDLVSGDFYFFHQDEEYKYAIIVDCTGHGVPGAMMSLVANSILKEVLLNIKARPASQILYELDRELHKSINSYASEISYDGMDVSVARIHKKTMRLHYCGAFRPALLLRNKQFIELRSNRYPIGFFVGVNKVFEEQVVLLRPDDTLYLFTDGYIDQFGGERNRKLNRKNFKELLLSINDLPIAEQEAFLEYSLNNWKQGQEQTDDVLVVGLKL